MGNDTNLNIAIKEQLIDSCLYGEIIMNKQLEKIIDLIPFIKEITNVDAAICVWNKDAVAEAFFPSKEVPGIRVEIGQ